MSEGKHTVGAMLGEVRVPERYLNDLENLAGLLRDTDRDIILGRVAALLSKATTAESLTAESHDRGIFNLEWPNFEKRFQPDYEIVGKISETMKLAGHPVVLTSGTYDLIHIGHARYLSSAKRHGDFLIVGVDSDDKVRQRKGPHRPIVPEHERMQMLAHLRSVDLITLKHAEDERWQLIKTVRPNTLIATEGSYTQEQVAELESEWVDRVVVLPPQAERSTSALVRLGNIAASKHLSANLRQALQEEVPDLSDDKVELIVAKTTGIGDGRSD